MATKTFDGPDLKVILTPLNAAGNPTGAPPQTLPVKSFSMTTVDSPSYTSYKTLSYRDTLDAYRDTSDAMNDRDFKKSYGQKLIHWDPSWDDRRDDTYEERLGYGFVNGIFTVAVAFVDLVGHFSQDGDTVNYLEVFYSKLPFEAALAQIDAWKFDDEFIGFEAFLDTTLGEVSTVDTIDSGTVLVHNQHDVFTRRMSRADSRDSSWNDPYYYSSMSSRYPSASSRYPSSFQKRSAPRADGYIEIKAAFTSSSRRLTKEWDWK